MRVGVADETEVCVPVAVIVDVGLLVGELVEIAVCVLVAETVGVEVAPSVELAVMVGVGDGPLISPKITDTVLALRFAT
jgi:hypothetical protein